MKGRNAGWVLAAAGVLAAGTVHAADVPQLTAADFHAIDSMLPAAQGRPNEFNRLTALKAYVKRDYGVARERFEVAALHADKFSQHALSLMHWHGVGGDADRAQAYIWADLAAERGASSLLAVRENMWNGLSAAERARVRQEGAAFYDRYGDAVAQPRAEGAMRRFAVDMTGSRVGFSRAPLSISGRPISGIYSPQMGSAASLYLHTQHATSDELYEGSRRDMVAYWKEQERAMTGSGRAGGLRDVRTAPHAP